jgi:hypothetical protein
VSSFLITPIPDLSQVRLDLDFSDLVGITTAYVVRVHPDGSRIPVRPSPVTLSGGLAVMYDTEAPLDTPFHYLAHVSVPQAGYNGVGGILATTVRPVFSDTFTRVVGAGSWGSTTPNTYPWTIVAGVAANFSVNGTQGLIAVSTTNSTRLAANTANWQVQNSQGGADFIVPDEATGAPVDLYLRTRFVGTLTGAQTRFVLRLRTNAMVDLVLEVRLADGTTIVLTEAFLVEQYTDGTTLKLKYVQIDNVWQAKVWRSIDPEPTAFQALNDNNLNADIIAGLGLAILVESGNSNPLPYNQLYDNLSVTSLDTFDTVILPSTINGLSGGWLRDPLRPCNDLRLIFCPPDDCPVTEGIILAAYGTETYAADAGRFPIQDRRRPVICYAIRKDAVGTLQLVSITCEDRDRLLTLLEPGSPLLFQLPPEYCVPDRYLDIGNVDVSPLARDLRRQWRLFDLPWVAVDAPGGPAQCVCGARWMDLCENYADWDLIDAAAFTIQEVLDGEATA